MKPDKMNDLLLEKAAISYVERKGAEIQAEMEALKENADLQPSKEQRARFLQFLKYEKSRLKKQKRRKHMLQFAGILLAVIVGLSSISYVFVEAFRVRVRILIKEYHETHMEIHTQDREETINREDVELAKYLPQGFEIVSHNISEGMRESIRAENDAGNFVRVSRIDEGGRTSVDTEEAEVWELIINDKEITVIAKNDCHNFIWHDIESYYMLLTDVSADVMTGILENTL